jgi:hypothetical protein
MKDAYEKQSLIFVRNIFIQTFQEFSSYWFKIKEIGDQSDFSNIQLSGNYSKSNFLKMIKTNFLGVITEGSFDIIVQQIS